jgi:hypothetical protein
LGRVTSPETPFHSLFPVDFIDLDENVELIKVANGFSHTLILTNEGRVYGFGTNMRGILGGKHLRVLANLARPELLSFKNIVDEFVIDIACGVFHSVFLTKSGNVFISGRNNEYQIVPRDSPDCREWYSEPIWLKYDGVRQIHSAARNTILVQDHKFVHFGSYRAEDHVYTAYMYLERNYDELVLIRPGWNGFAYIVGQSIMKRDVMKMTKLVDVFYTFK